MYENDKEPSAPAKDDFWKLDGLLSEKESVSTPENVDTEGIEVDFDQRESTHKSLFEQARPVLENRGIERLPQDRRETVMKNHRTPGDVAPMMGEPVTDYEPSHSLLRHVEVYRWPAKYNYYERFRADAMRYFDRAGEECPFVPFYAYMPQYGQMTREQLNWYFYWRENLHQGKYLQTEYSYIFLYLYEIINLPEKISPAQGLKQMLSVWLSYREKFTRLDRYLGEWVCDWCLIHALPAPLEALGEVLSELPDKVSLKEFYIRYEGDERCPLDPTLTDMLSNYNWRASKYATPQSRPYFEKHLYASVLGVMKEKWQAGNVEEMLGLNLVRQTRDAFGGALCSYQSKRRIDVEYISFSRSYPLRFLLTNLYKYAENQIRAHLGIKARLNTPNLDEETKKQMRAYFDRFLPAKSKTEKETAKKEREDAKKRMESGAALAPEYAAFYQPVTTELSEKTAKEIEKQSWQTTQILIAAEQEHQPLSSQPVGEENLSAQEYCQTQQEYHHPAQEDRSQGDGHSSPVTAFPPTPLAEEDVYVQLVMSLDAVHFAALRDVIGGEDDRFAALCREKHLIGDSLTEQINEKSLELTSDVILESDGGTFWCPVAEYTAQITDAVAQRLEQEEKTV